MKRNLVDMFDTWGFGGEKWELCERARVSASSCGLSWCSY